MKKILILICFATIITNAYSFGDGWDKGPMAKAGDIIHGVVKDANGFIQNAKITEYHKGREIASTYTDKNGQFAIKYLEKGAFFVAECTGYHMNGFKFSSTDIGFYMISDTVFNPNAARSYPFLILNDGKAICDSLKWKDIVPMKDYEFYMLEDLALMLGIKADDIEDVSNVGKGRLYEIYGIPSDKHAFVVYTKEYKK